jgi:glycosyltransferase involved in cell wall biosynthesis
MYCPTLTKLPFSPPGKTGWPWTEESKQLPGGSSWPRVSIVTPSYNQAQFIEETIRSVLLQGYPDLEYIIIDGGSTDGSVEIIRKYEPWLAYWVSELDTGQADAIQKGFTRITGDIVAYLNSDDIYLPNAIATAVSVFQDTRDLALVYGDLIIVDEASQVVGKRCGFEGEFTEFFLSLTDPIPQPSAFLTRAALDAAGGLDPNFHMLMDFDLWARVGLRGMKMKHIPKNLSRFRLHGESKTGTSMLSFAQERWKLAEKCLADPVLGPGLLPYKNRIYGSAHLRSAGAYWFHGQRRAARAHFWKAIRMAPRVVLSLRGLSLLVRFILKRR